LRGQLHQPGHIHLHRRRPARQVTLDPLQPGLQVALAPARNLHPPDAELLGDVLVLQALRSQQHDARALRQPDAGALGARQLHQFALILIRQNNCRGNSHAISPMQTEVEHWRSVIHLGSHKSGTLH
jgi:hypothetical protein